MTEKDRQERVERIT